MTVFLYKWDKGAYEAKPHGWDTDKARGKVMEFDNNLHVFHIAYAATHVCFVWQTIL